MECAIFLRLVSKFSFFVFPSVTIIYLDLVLFVFIIIVQDYCSWICKFKDFFTVLVSQSFPSPISKNIPYIFAHLYFIYGPTSHKLYYIIFNPFSPLFFRLDSFYCSIFKFTDSSFCNLPISCWVNPVNFLFQILCFYAIECLYFNSLFFFFRFLICLCITTIILLYIPEYGCHSCFKLLSANSNIWVISESVSFDCLFSRVWATVPCFFVC